MLRELRAQTRAALVAANAANSRLEILEDRFERRIVPAIADIARHERQIDGLNTKTQKLAEMFNQNMNIMADEKNGRPAEQQCQNYLLCQFAKYVACLH